MYKLNYCLDCQRVFTIDDKCKYCNSKNVRELKRGKAVNIIGDKNKARFLRYKDGKVSVILYTEDKQKIIKDFEIEKIIKNSVYSFVLHYFLYKFINVNQIVF